MLKQACTVVQSLQPCTASTSVCTGSSSLTFAAAQQAQLFPYNRHALTIPFSLTAPTPSPSPTATEHAAATAVVADTVRLCAVQCLQLSMCTGTDSLCVAAHPHPQQMATTRRLVKHWRTRRTTIQASLELSESYDHA